METLEEQDRLGPPYVVYYGTGPAGRAMPDYARAVEIARSAHPSRMLANTNVYRYGLFEEYESGGVTVRMMGSHIATFLPEGVRLWSCGWITTTTAEALNNLVTGGWFYTRNGVIYFHRYSDDRDTELPLEEGQLFPYATGG
jgi:hypothetical protein